MPIERGVFHDHDDHVPLRKMEQDSTLLEPKQSIGHELQSIKEEIHNEIKQKDEETTELKNRIHDLERENNNLQEAYDGHQQLHIQEEHEKEAEEMDRFKNLTTITKALQKKIEASGDIDNNARIERGVMGIDRQDGSNYDFYSRHTKTSFTFRDYDRVTIKGRDGHDLNVDINPVDGLGGLVKVLNIINMMKKNANNGIEIDDGMVQSKSRRTKLTNGMGGWGDTDTDIIDANTLNDLGVNVQNLVTYINEYHN